MKPRTTMQAAAPTTFGSDGDVLPCPRCRGEGLHQLVVTVYERPEDAPDVLEVMVFAPGDCRVTTGPGDDNPSRRSNGAVMTFWCDACGNDPDKHVELVFNQHDGRTEVFWLYDDTEAA